MCGSGTPNGDTHATQQCISSFQLAKIVWIRRNWPRPLNAMTSSAKQLSAEYREQQAATPRKGGVLMVCCTPLLKRCTPTHVRSNWPSGSQCLKMFFAIVPRRENSATPPWIPRLHIFSLQRLQMMTEGWFRSRRTSRSTSSYRSTCVATNTER